MSPEQTQSGANKVMDSTMTTKGVKVSLPKVQFTRNEHHFSVKQMVIFFLIFALLGVYLIWHSFAAQPKILTIEAETMPIPAGAEKVYDSTASASNYMRFNSVGTASTTFTLPSEASTITVRTRGASCSGNPSLVLKVDGNQIASKEVTATSWTTYTFNLSTTIKSGAHTLSVGFPYDNNSGCDRKLAVDNLLFYGPEPVVESLISQGKTVTASSSSSSYPASNTVDGVTTTRWSSTYSDPQWLMVDLGTSMKISHVRLNWEVAYGKAYQIQTSEDQTTWTTLYSTTTSDGGIDDLTGLSGVGRYVRLNGTTRATQWGYSLWEMQVYGSSAPVIAPPAPTVSLAPSPSTITAGSATTLTWSSTNATSCSATGGWSGTQATSGTASTGVLSATTTYNLTCVGSGGSKSVSTTVNVTTPPTASGSIYWGAFISGSDTYSSYYPGTTWGNTPWDSNTWNKFESNAGKKVSILHFGQPRPWLRAFEAGPLNLINARGAIPYLDMDSGINIDAGDGYNTTEMAKIANGAYDSSIVTWANAAKAYGKPFLYRWNREMNGLWYDYGKEESRNPGVFVRSWKHMHDVIAPIAPNVTWVWCPNIDPDNNKTALTQLYPGDAYVDWTCLDGYNMSTSTATSWRSFSNLYRSTYDKVVAMAPNKPMLIGEVSSREISGSKAQWITDMLKTQLPNNFPKIKAFSWFNWRINEDGQYNPWPIESSASSSTAPSNCADTETATCARAAFKSGVASPYYAPGGSYGNLPAGTKVMPLP